MVRALSNISSPGSTHGDDLRVGAVSREAATPNDPAANITVNESAIGTAGRTSSIRRS
jgi:hypothetical protein